MFVDYKDELAAAAGFEAHEGVDVCDGADARYVGVANERVFAALPVSAAVALAGTYGEPAHVFGPFRRPAGPLKSPAPRRPQHRDAVATATPPMFRHSGAATPTTAALSQQLTPVRRGSLGRSPQQRPAVPPPLPPSQTAQAPPPRTPPYHATSYDQDRYQRCLTAALLSSAEAGGRHANVLSFPMRTPNRRRQSSGSRATPDVPSRPSACVSQHTVGLTHTPPSTTGEPDDVAGWAVTASLGSPTREAARRSGETRAPAIAAPWSTTPTSQPGAPTSSDRDGVVSPRVAVAAGDGDGTDEDVVQRSPTACPLTYFLRAPPVWPTVALVTPSRRRWVGDTSDESEEGGCSAVVIDSGVLPPPPAAAAEHVARREVGMGCAAWTPALPHTPNSTQSDSALAEAAFTSSAGPATPQARWGASVAAAADRADGGGASTPLHLPCSTAQRVAVFNSPCHPPLPARRGSAAHTTAHHHGEADSEADSEEEAAGGGHDPSGPAQPTLSTPVGRRVTAVGLSCATPVGAAAGQGPPPLWGTAAAPESALAASPASPAVLRRASGGLPGAAFPALHATRRASTPPFLSTPVRHHENSMRGGSVVAASAALAVSSAALRRGPGASPLDSTPTRPSFAAAPYHSPHHLGLRQALDVGGRRSGSGGGGSGVRGRHHADGQSRTSPQRRDVFHFTRALTAGEVSMSERHRPLSWGCFGILVAQPAEVWCVGKQQPFRLFPAAAEQAAPAWMPRAEALTVTAVATTGRLTWAQWETAAGASSVSGVAALARGPAATAAPAAAAAAAAATAGAVVYAAIGTADGDVIVYGYARCPPSAPGAIAVSLGVDPAVAGGGTHAVHLQWHGILRRADRVGGGGGVEAVEEDTEGQAETSPRTPTAAAAVAALDHTISALHIADHWLYIGDQCGHLARYNLRHASFLESLTASRSAAAAAGTGAAGGLPLPSAAAARAPAAVRLHACMPVHRFGRPPVLGGGRAPTTPAPTYHYAIHVGEPVYHLAVTDNQSCLAVGTQTRLLVYRTAQLPRVPDAPLSSSPAAPPSEKRAATVEPLVVVRDAAQPVRCFAWMLCDYEAAMRSPDRRVPLDVFAGVTDACDDGAAAGLGKSEYDGDSDLSSPMPLTSDEDVAVVRSFAMSAGAAHRGHTPTPSLVFAVAHCGNAAATEAVGHALPSSWGAPLRTDIRVFRLVTETTVTSCTIDYPARMLAVLPGTTQLIVATGGEAELAAPSVAHESTGVALPSTPTAAAEPHAALSLSTASTSPASPSFSATTSAASSPMAAARRTGAGAAAGAAPAAGLTAPWHAPFTLRPTVRSTNAGEGSGAATPQRPPPPPPPPRTVTGEERDGYLFLLEVCPADDVAGGDVDEDAGVRLRVRGEVRLGEGESAVCGSVSPALDHVSVLVRPTEVDARWGRAAAATAAAAAVAMPVTRDTTRNKVKVWRVHTEAPAVACADVSPGCGPLFLSEAQQQMESLR